MPIFVLQGVSWLPKPSMLYAFRRKWPNKQDRGREPRWGGWDRHLRETTRLSRNTESWGLKDNGLAQLAAQDRQLADVPHLMRRLQSKHSGDVRADLADEFGGFVVEVGVGQRL